jgi:pilus assembly protein CpaC
MRKYLILALAGSSFILSGVSNSAQLVAPDTTPKVAAAGPEAPVPPQPSPTPAPALGGPSVATEIPASGRPILLEAGKGTLIRLPRPAGTVFIASPDIADVQVKSPSLIYLNAKAPGETVLYAVDADDKVLVNAPVRVEQDLSRLRQSLHAFAPGQNVQLSSVDNQLLLSGRVATAGDAAKVNALARGIADETKGRVINELSVATPNQVNLRVKVAEVNRSVLKALGFNISKTAGNIQFTTQNPFTNAQIINQNLFQFAIGGHNGRFLATLDALAQENLLTTLAEPNLTATNGQTASFLAGGEFPVPVAGAAATAGGAPTITIDFKKFGVSLDFTPTIIDANHVSLRVRPEVSELSTTGQVSVPLTGNATVTIPALTVRRADTTVELGSGESFALAGLMQNTTQQNVSKIPGLGDIPILGQLFRSDLFQRNETELVIIVTPYLVKPIETALAAPTDGFIAPHDVQRTINSDVYRQTLPPPGKGPLPPGGQGLIGSVGFVLD